MDTSTINIAERVKDARRDAKLTQTELGKRIGKSKQWVSELERGNIKLSFLSEFSYDVLEKFNVGIIERRCYKFDSVFIKRLACIIVSYWCDR